MTDELKDLSFYEANPDQLPNDPEQIAALLAQLEGEYPAAGESTEQSEFSAIDGADDGASEADRAQTKGASPSQQDHGEPQVEEEAPIASKDGKHTIPYSVLASEREKRRAAEQAARELQERIAAAESGRSASDSTEQSDDELEEMAKEFPLVGRLLEHTRKLESRLNDVAKHLEAEDAARNQIEVDRVRAAVDANPVLLHWEQNDPERWAAAIEADQRLQSSPAHQRLSLEDRLQKAVEAVELFMGPDQSAPAHSNPQIRTTQKPAASLAARKPIAATPRTLSDIPGGAVPSTDPLEEFASISAAELGARMAGMDVEKIEALLNRFG